MKQLVLKIYLASYMAWITITGFSAYFTARFRRWLSNSNNTGELVSKEPYIRKWAQQLLDIIHVELTLNNFERFEKPGNRSIIFLSNHASYYDSAILLAAIPGLHMVANSGLFKIPICSFVMRYVECIPITTNNTDKAKKDLQYTIKLLNRYQRIWMSPEGGRSRDGKIKALKKGAFHLAIDAKTMIVPVGIVGSRDIWAPDSSRINRNQKVSVNIGRPIDAANYSKNQLPMLLSEVEQQLIDLIS